MNGVESLVSFLSLKVTSQCGGYFTEPPPPSNVCLKKTQRGKEGHFASGAILRKLPESSVALVLYLFWYL